MANDDTVAQIALMNLASQLIGHRTDVKRIEAETQLQQDKILFQAEKDKRKEALELEKAKFSLNMQDLKTAETEYKIKQEEHKKRGLKMNDETTKSFKELDEAHGKGETWEALTNDAAASLNATRDMINQMDTEITTLDNALEWIAKHGSHEGGADPDRWDPEDYNANIEKVKAHLGIAELSDSIMSGLEKKRPGQDALDSLNIALDKKVIESETAKEARATFNIKNELNTVKNQREAITSYPEYSELTGSMSSIFEQIMIEKDNRADKNMLKAIEKVQKEHDTPIMDIIGATAYTKAVAHAKTAPDELVLTVIEPIKNLLASFKNFQKNYPDASDEMKNAFFEKASKILGHDDYDPNSFNEESLEEAALEMLKLTQAQPHILGFARNTRKRYREAVDEMVKRGIPESNINRLNEDDDPVMRDLLEMINTLETGDYEGDEEYEAENKIQHPYAAESMWKNYRR